MKRYRMFDACCFVKHNSVERTPPGMEEDPQGEWMKWEDHESICTSLVKRKNACEREVKSLKDEIRRIKAIIAESEQHEVVKVKDVNLLLRNVFVLSMDTRGDKR